MVHEGIEKVQESIFVKAIQIIINFAENIKNL